MNANYSEIEKRMIENEEREREMQESVGYSTNY
jgi:hypothetical protein